MRRANLNALQSAIVAHGTDSAHLDVNPQHLDVEVLVGPFTYPEPRHDFEHPKAKTSTGRCVAWQNDDGTWSGQITTCEGGGTWREPTLDDVRARLAEHVSFVVRYWVEKVQWRANGDRTDDGLRVVRRNGRHSIIGAEPTPDQLRRNSIHGGLGHSGRLIRFRLLDTGEVIESRNVWSQGRIPDDFRILLPDNAE